MKRRLSAFLAGVLTAALLGTLTATALAASGAVEFNAVGVIFNGVPISHAGESFTLSNGVEAPSVINYTDEKGGGTTYLPARRLAELLGVEIGWDAASGSVTIGATPDEPIQTPSAVNDSAAPEDQPVTVYITDHGAKYHRAGCRYLAKSQIAISLSEAKRQAYDPCAICAG